MRRSVAALSAAFCLAAPAGCGRTPAGPPSPQADREWIDNTAGVIDQLERDLALESTGGDTLAAARRTLHDGLYTVLVAYTDFGGCRHMVAAAGDAPARFASVSRPLAAACVKLERAAVLFTRAASRNDAAALLAASRTASSAAPLLLRARVAIQAAVAATSR